LKSGALSVALYARVSSEQQAKDHTIASQVEALRQRIREDRHTLEEELCFIDEGYSGSTVVRPALERLRDQAAAGAIDRLYVHSPDRLARRYAYQVLLVDELHRAGVELVFLNHPIGRTAEEDLLLQVQGMVAEYERAKILERSRRGKLHAARRGAVSVLGGAPYGYRYVGKYAGAGEARYDVVFEEAPVVQRIFEWVGRDGSSIAEVCRRLKAEGIPTRSGKNYWDRTTVWGMLKNPAYRGTAAFGKTRVGELRPRLRPARGHASQPRRGYSTYDTCDTDQISIAVPAIIDKALFAVVQEQLTENRKRCRQRARGARHLLQGLLVCRGCGYAFYGKAVSLKSSRGRRRDYAYYRCVGSDAYRFGGQRVCHNRQVRTDLLEIAEWEDVRDLLANPDRIQHEYERRLNDENRDDARRGEHLTPLIQRSKRGIARLIDAYQDGVLEKHEFEPRIEAARRRLTQLEAAAQEAADRATQEAALRLVIGQLHEFASRVQQGLDHVDWALRRELIRAVVKRVEVGEDEIRVIYKVGPSDRGPEGRSLQDCWRRERAALRRALVPLHRHAVGHGPGHEVAADQPQRASVRDPPRQSLHQHVVVHPVEELRQVHVGYPASARLEVALRRPHRLVRAAPRSEAVAGFGERRVEVGLQHLKQALLDEPVEHRRDAESSRPPAGLGDLLPLHRLRLVAPREQLLTDRFPVRDQIRRQVVHGHPVHAGTALVLLHPPQRRERVGASDHLLHEPALGS
jgi:site-specific DNA recombinase